MLACVNQWWPCHLEAWSTFASYLIKLTSFKCRSRMVVNWRCIIIVDTESIITWAIVAPVPFFQPFIVFENFILSSIEIDHWITCLFGVKAMAHGSCLSQPVKNFGNDEDMQKISLFMSSYPDYKRVLKGWFYMSSGAAYLPAYGRVERVRESRWTSCCS